MRNLVRFGQREKLTDPVQNLQLLLSTMCVNVCILGRSSYPALTWRPSSANVTATSFHLSRISWSSTWNPDRPTRLVLVALDNNSGLFAVHRLQDVQIDIVVAPARVAPYFYVVNYVVRRAGRAERTGTRRETGGSALMEARRQHLECGCQRKGNGAWGSSYSRGGGLTVSACSHFDGSYLTHPPSFKTSRNG